MNLEAIIEKNLQSTTPIDCTKYIHDMDREALEALKKIPLLDKVCSKVISVMNDTQNTIINMSSKIHITEKQLPKVYRMVQSICNRLGIEMPEIFLELNRTPNAYAFGAEKFTIVINSGLFECLEDDELYAVLAHECAHIACKHGLYHTVGDIVLGGGMIGLNEISAYLDSKGFLGGIMGDIVSLVDGALELAFYHWSRCSELSCDRVAAICCGEAEPVIETMMRLAGGTAHLSSEINKELFIAQAEAYQKSVEDNLVNKGLEFLFTKDKSHPLLAVRAAEVQKFAASDGFKRVI